MTSVRLLSLLLMLELKVHSLGRQEEKMEESEEEEKKLESVNMIWCP